MTALYWQTEKNVCRKCESIQYPVLYDKKVKGFKESHTVQ